MTVPAALVAGLVALAAAGPGAQVAVERGTIHAGRGVGPIELGMTRAQVVAKLGRPLAVNGARHHYSRDNVLDVDLDASGRVVQITASGLRFCTPGGACLLRSNNVAVLQREFPGRVKRIQPYGRPLYIVGGSRLGGRTTYTTFFADRHAPKPTALEVYVSYCAEGCR